MASEIWMDSSWWSTAGTAAGVYTINMDGVRFGFDQYGNQRRGCETCGCACGALHEWWCGENLRWLDRRVTEMRAKL